MKRIAKAMAVLLVIAVFLYLQVVQIRKITLKLALYSTWSMLLLIQQEMALLQL